MQEIGKVNKQIKCIPNNMRSMDFFYSFQFMSFSLEKLVDNHVKEGPTKCYHMTEYFGTEKIDLLLRKQIYPYGYLDSECKFTEEQLPPKEAFYSSLSGEDISVEDYAHAQYVWKDFNIQNLGQYHDLYVLNDVLSQGDVFKNLEICLNYNGLDAAHFYTSPGPAWQAVLKMTGVQLELLTDIDMHLFIENGLRGGISMITQTCQSQQ
jgi:hypothetical protein